MSSFTPLDTMRFVGTVLESSFYGLYCVAFAVHARIRSKKKGGGTNIAIYPLSLLFFLCTIFCAIDTAQTLFILRYESTLDTQVGIASYGLNIANTAFYCAITFLAQGTLIYRCWLMWGKKVWLITIPTILAWASFGTSLVMVKALIEPSSNRIPDQQEGLFYPIGTAAFSVALGVNAIVAILLAVKIYMVQVEAEISFTVKKHKADFRPFRRIISIFNDSGMLMLACQIIWLVLFRRGHIAFYLVKGPIVMIYGLTPTLILQRVAPFDGVLSQNSIKPPASRTTTIRFAANNK